MKRSPALASLRVSLLAAMGLSACAGEVVVTTGGTTGSGGGGATTTSTGSVGTTTSTGGPPMECAGATPVVLADGTDSGFARCPDGTIHRVEPVACDVNAGVVACTGMEMMPTCKLDTDCTMAPHGRCGQYTESTFGGPIVACGCVYPCANDAECGAGQACICAGVVTAQQAWAACGAATCTTGKDCPSGECGISSFNNGCGVDVELACRAGTDPCRLDAQCSAAAGEKCVLGVGPTWVCSGTTCANGRPLMVDGRARTAPAVEGDAWASTATAPDLAGLDAGDRAILTRHWLDLAALEHASVASFALFTLELLALGAPAALVSEAQRAGLDEVEHARVAYSLASAYAGRSLGPGALDLSSVKLRTGAREIVRALVTEACVGETLGVAEALAMADRVVDPFLRQTHARIAADEQRHAELAWRSLAWLLATGDAELTGFAARCFDEASAAMARDPEPRPGALPGHGVLASTELGAIRRRALREVVAPCAAAVLSGAPRGGSDSVALSV
jgi:hypothetical protein